MNWLGGSRLWALGVPWWLIADQGGGSASLPALPPQLLPNPGLDNPAAWTVAGGWSLSGGQAVHTTGTGQFSKLTALNVPSLGNATDLVMSFEVPSQTSTDVTQGARGMLAGNTSNNVQYHGWWNRTDLNPDIVHRVIPHVSHIYNRTPAQNTVMIESSTLWIGSLRNPRLYDISFSRKLATVILIIAGQSNAEGYGEDFTEGHPEGDIDPALDFWHPNIWVCPHVNLGLYGAKANVASIAQEPLVHCGSPGHKVGPAMEIARQIVAATNGAVRVLIVPVAKSGTGVISGGAAAPWNPDTTATGDLRRYPTMISTYQAALAQVNNHIGTIMYWSGNEADLQVATWQANLPAAMRNFVTRARADLGVPDMPIIMSSAVIPNPAAPSALVQMQRSFAEDSGSPNAIPGVRYVEGPEGAQWINTTDVVHFTTAANRIRGRNAGLIAAPIVQAMLSPPVIAPAVASQPTILPAGAVVGDSVTLDLGAATGTPAPVAAWTLTRDGVDISAQVDGFMAMELTQDGAYQLSVTWTNSAGSVTATASLVVDPVATPFDRAASVWADFTPASPITGTPAAVTGIQLGGTGAVTMSTAATGTNVQLTADGAVYEGGKYSAATVTVPMTGGVILIAEFRLAQASDTGTILDLGADLYIRQGGANLQYGYNLGAPVIVTAKPAVAGEWQVLAIEMDRDAGTIRYWDGDEIVTVTGLDASTFAQTQVRAGQSALATVRQWSIATKAAGGAWTATLEQLLASYGVGAARVSPPGPFDRLRVMPALIQSEARPDVGEGAAMLAGDTGRGWAVSGLRDAAGAALYPWGAGVAQMDQAVPATGFAEASTMLLGRSSEVYATLYSWLRGQAATTRALIGDNGFGGLYVEQYLIGASGWIGENNLYYLQEVDRLAALAGIVPDCPWFYHFIGTSAKSQPYADARAAIVGAWDQLIGQAQTLFGAAPDPVLVQTGGDVNTVADLYQQVQAQYDLTVQYGGVIATHQRIWPIADGNIHPNGRTGVLIGELCGIALREVEAGRDWTVTAAVAKSGATVTVTFDLRPGETLVNRAGLYDAYGGAATCPHLGFEADGGIAATSINAAAGTVTITLNNSSATWLRFALQRQDVSAAYYEATPGDAASRVWLSAHRTTLFPSETFASVAYPGETLWRSLPSFEGIFAGDAFTFGPS